MPGGLYSELSEYEIADMIRDIAKFTRNGQSYLQMSMYSGVKDTIKKDIAREEAKDHPNKMLLDAWKDQYKAYELAEKNGPTICFKEGYKD